MTDFAELMQKADQPMVVVTTASDGRRAGCLVGFHSQSSIDPARYSIWLSKANRTFGLAVHARVFAVHFLADVDRDLAELFGGETGDEIDKFERCDVSFGPDGVPLLARCPHFFVARRVASFDDGGDHVCFTLEVVESASPADLRPLRVSDVEHISPGHEPGERRRDGT